MDVRVGLDFGTHQTKVCVNYQKKGQLPVFEFVNFGENGEVSFFLSSKVNLLENDLITVGDSSEAKKSFRYFKIASAEDEAFRGISGLKQNKQHYELSRYGQVSPEVLSIIYLSQVIGLIESKFEERHKNQKKTVKKTSFMGQFLNRKAEQKDQKPSYRYHYQIGIPTEWSAEKNLWRKRKFEQILFLAKEIHETHSFDFLKGLNFDKQIELIKQHYEILARKLKYESWDNLLKDSNISAFPETAAGLTYLIKTGKIPEGYYLALDIGGGSSDISFFRVNENRTFEYLASESLLIASNDVYDAYSSYLPEKKLTEDIHHYIELQDKDSLDKDEYYREAYKDTMKRLSLKIKKIYNARVYRRFVKTVANRKFGDQSCFLYGGGSLLYRPTKGMGKIMEKLLLHDQGTESLTATRTYAEIDLVRNIEVPDQVKPDGWKEFLPLLIVPLGLSYIQPDHTYDWNDTFYEPGEGQYRIDDDPGLFDVFRRRWV